MKESISQAPSIERKKEPKLLLKITRHEERDPLGELTKQGIERATKKGEKMRGKAEVLKGYASDEETKRTVHTSDSISEASGIESRQLKDHERQILESKRIKERKKHQLITNEELEDNQDVIEPFYPSAPIIEEELQEKLKSIQVKNMYATREVEDIQYDVLNPDLSHILKEASPMIDEATLKELDENGGYPLEKDGEGKITTKLKELFKKLPQEKQDKVALIRQKNQIIGLRHAMKKPEAVRRMAMGLAHQELKELGIGQRYVSSRAEKKPKKPLKNDVILNTNTHGLFMESLLSEAGFYINEKGEKAPITNIENENIGGFMQPGESITLDIGEDLFNPPREIPVIFEGENRPEAEKVFIDFKKMQELDQEYRKWKETPERKGYEQQKNILKKS